MRGSNLMWRIYNIPVAVFEQEEAVFILTVMLLRGFYGMGSM